MSEMEIPTKLVSVLGGKGGVGKTSLAVGLALMLGRDQSVALVDADPQGSASRWMIRWMRDTGGDIDTVTIEQQPDMRGATIDAVRRAVEMASLVIADAPPGSPEILRALASLSDLVVIPTGASSEELHLARRVLRAVEEEATVRRSPIPTLIVPTRWNSRTKLSRAAVEYLDTLGSPVAAPIHERIAWQRASSSGVWLDDVGDQAAEAEAEAVAASVREALNPCAT